MKTRQTTMERAFVLLWHGLVTIIVGIVGWVWEVLGMRDRSWYGRLLHRVVGTCFALLMIMLVAAAAWGCYEELHEQIAVDESNMEDTYRYHQYVSGTVSYYYDYGADGYLQTADGETTITGIRWIATPLGTDSLVCYSNGEKRGYFNMFTGRPVIEPRYDHAWIFSDGLAAVDDGGWIKFIDATGRVVIDPRISYVPGMDDYVFHNGHCVLRHDRLSRYGMIDRQGRWVVQPEYVSIEPERKFWVACNGEERCVMDSALNIVVPFLKGYVDVQDEYISVTLDTHVMQRYALDGKLISDFYINDVTCLLYESDELRYVSTKDYNEDGTYTVTEDDEPRPVKKMAKCRRYEAETGYYGLITSDGKVITPPAYTYIKAIAPDLYLCQDNDEDGIILNGKGERIR